MKVKFVPQNIELEIAQNQSVKDLADKNGIFIKSICNGLPSCAECRVKIVEGEHNVLPPSNKEMNLIGTGYFIDGRRLSCQLMCFGDLTVDLTEQIEKQKTAHTLRPQGSKKSAEQSSHAVAGNFIEQDEDLKNIKLSGIEEKSENQSRNQGQNARQNQSAGSRNEQHHRQQSGGDRGSQRNNHNSHRGDQKRGSSQNNKRGPSGHRK